MSNSCVASLISQFNQLFVLSENTELVSGGAEPYYHPATGNTPAKIVFREDFFASALHEISHWCIAGAQRRQLPDFGYWYEPDGRNAEQQTVFEQVEVKPQAVEWALSIAAGVSFHFSADNLNAASGVSDAFKQSVWKQCSDYFEQGLPPRAQLLFDALRSGRHVVKPAKPC